MNIDGNQKTQSKKFFTTQITYAILPQAVKFSKEEGGKIWQQRQKKQSVQQKQKKAKSARILPLASPSFALLIRKDKEAHVSIDIVACQKFSDPIGLNIHSPVRGFY